jgi:hypothetical protein
MGDAERNPGDSEFGNHRTSSAYDVRAPQFSDQPELTKPQDGDEQHPRRVRLSMGTDADHEPSDADDRVVLLDDPAAREPPIDDDDRDPAVQERRKKRPPGR